ncbi:MAG: hypothetical protein LBH53_02500 [Puniceicoccales bacterium]|jgi:hypothetical protein|nr:hypothetical protein [Puniceicoccales bacterium]
MGDQNAGEAKNPFFTVRGWQEAVASIGKMGFGNFLAYCFSKGKDGSFIDRHATAQDLEKYVPLAVEEFSKLERSKQSAELQSGDAVYAMTNLVADNPQLVKEFVTVLDLCVNRLPKKALMKIATARPSVADGTGTNSSEGNLLACVISRTPNREIMEAVRKFINAAFKGNLEEKREFMGAGLKMIVNEDVVSSLTRCNGRVLPEERRHNATILFAQLFCYGWKERDFSGNFEKTLPEALALLPKEWTRELVFVLKNCSEDLTEFADDINPPIPDDGLYKYSDEKNNLLHYTALYYGKESAEYAATLEFYQFLQNHVDGQSKINLEATIKAVMGLNDVGYDILNGNYHVCAGRKLREASTLTTYHAGARGMPTSIYEGTDLLNNGATHIPFRSLGWLPNLETVTIGVYPSFITLTDVRTILEHGKNQHIKFIFDTSYRHIGNFTDAELKALEQEFPGRVTVKGSPQIFSPA